jgi:DNA-directed RNA polymerase subunit F
MAVDGDGEGRHVSLADVKAMLERAAKERVELTYEQKLALEHAQRFSKLPPAKSKELLADLKKLDFVNDFIAFRLTDILPRNDVELRAVFQKAKTPLGDKEAKQVLAVLEKHAPL